MALNNAIGLNPSQRAVEHVMPEMSLSYPIPTNEDDFDHLCCVLLSRHWAIPNLSRHGRRGQRQNGVDFYGQNERGDFYAGQSKLRTGAEGLTEVDVRTEIERAKAFQPPLALYAIATSAKRDVHLQKLERAINLEHRRSGLFAIKLFFWEDLHEFLHLYTDVRDAIYGGVSSSQLVEIKSTLDAIGSAVQQRTIVVCEGHSHADIDEAVQSLRSGDWRLARRLLERMRDRQWTTYGAVEKFRVLANLGHTYEQEGNYDQAAKYFIQASVELPNDERARVRAICAHSYFGNSELAHKLAAELTTAHPENADGHALWIRTAFESMTFAELKQSVPIHLRREPNVAFELSRRALSERHFDEAEDFARTGFAKEPDDPLLLAQLGTVLLMREASRDMADGRFVPTGKSRENLCEAIERITQSLNSPTNEANIAARADLLIKRSVAHDLLGNQVQRQEDIAQAHVLCPQNVDVSIKFAVMLDEQGQIDDAIQLLESLVAVDPGTRPSLMLAQLLSVRNAPADRNRALSLALCAAKSISVTQDEFGFLADFIVRLSIMIGQPQQGEDYLGNAGKATLSESLQHVLLGRIRLAANDRAAAKQCATNALAAVSTITSRFDRLQLGRLLYSVQEYEQAVAVLADVVTPNIITNDTIRLLEAAQKCDDVEFILHFCAGLRDAGIFDSQCVDLELSCLQQGQCLQAAIQIIQDLISKVTDDDFRRELIVRRSILGIQTDQQALIETDPAQFPAVETVNPTLGHMVVVLIHRGEEPLRGVEYAYELVRRHFSDHDARAAMVAAFGFASGDERRIDLPATEAVLPGTAVAFQEGDSGTIEWRIIEDSLVPKLEYNELAPDHAMAQELMGKRVGDEFHIRKNSVQDRIATICEIVPKYVYRLRECLGSWEERFPNQFFVQQMSFKQTPDGQPDLSPIFKSVDQKIQRTQAIDSLYRDNPVSLYSVAQAQGEPIISIMTHFSGHQEIAIKCCQFAERDLQILRTLSLANRVVLDPSALATLLLTDTFETLLVPSVQWAITEGTYGELYRWRERIRGNNAEGGFITKIDGHHVMLPHDAFDHTKLIQRFELFEAVVNDRIAIDPGDELFRCARQIRQQLVTSFGPACAQTVATAMRPGHFLWTDDMVVAFVATDIAKCSRVWTQGVAGWLAEGGQITSDSHDELSLRLIESNYSYTLMSPSTVLLAANKSNWNPDERPLKKCIDWFANRATRPETLFRLFAGTLKMLWTEAVLLQTAEPITLRLLDKIAELPDGRAMIREIRSNIQVLFGLNVVAAESLGEIIDGWDASGGRRGRIVLPRP